MEQDAQQRILEYFIEEARDHLNTMEQGLMELQYSDDPADVLRELFRAAHSVKGGAAMLGLQAILGVSHKLEDCFNILQDRQLHIDQELESYLLQGLDLLKVMFYALPTIDPAINEQCLADMGPIGEKIAAKLNNLSMDSVQTLEPFEIEQLWLEQSELIETLKPFELEQATLVEKVELVELVQEEKPEISIPPVASITGLPAPIVTTLVHTPLSPDQQRILGYFIEEAQENLGTAERNLLALSTPDFDPSLDLDEIREELYRSFHSIKGGAAMLHLQAIRQIAFRLEHFCREIHNQPALFDAVLHSYLGQAQIILKGVVDRLPTVNLELDEAALQEVEPLLMRIEQKLNGIEVAAYEPVPVEIKAEIEALSQTEPEFVLAPMELPLAVPVVEASAPIAETEPEFMADFIELPVFSDTFEVPVSEVMAPAEEMSEAEPEFVLDTPAVPILADMFEAPVELEANSSIIDIEPSELIFDIEVIPQAEPVFVEAELVTVPLAFEAPEPLEPELVEISAALSQAEPELVAPVEPELLTLPAEFLEEVDEGIYALQECFIQPRFEPVREEILTLARTLTELGTANRYSQWENLCQTLAMALLRSGDSCWQEMGFRVLAEFQQAKALILQGDGAQVKPSPWLMECAGFPVPVIEEVEEQSTQEILSEVLAEEQSTQEILGEVLAPEMLPEIPMVVPEELFEQFAPEVVEAPAAELVVLGVPEIALGMGLAASALESLLSEELELPVSEAVVPLVSMEAPTVEPIASVAGLSEEESLGDILAQLFAPPKDDFIVAPAPVLEPLVKQEQVQEQDTIASLSSLFPEDEPVAVSETADSLADLFTSMPEMERESTPASRELASTVTSDEEMDLAALFDAPKETAEQTQAADILPTPATPAPKATPAARPARRPTRTGTSPERAGREIPRPAVAASAESRAPLSGPVVRRTMRVEVRHLDGLSNLVGELVINRNTLENQQTRLRASLEMLQQRVTKMDRVSRELEEYYDKSVLGIQAPGATSSPIADINRGQEAFDALEMDRYTAFHTLSQEIMELIVRIKEASDDIEFVTDESDETSRQFRQTSSQLQDGLNQIRMLPLSELVDRLPRAVRDLSINMGKEVELELLGRETLLDKAILEELYDPLTHLTTNALMHGIEPIEERRRLNKKAKGKITVSASHQGNQTIISVKDDGRGLDARRIRAKAVERGLLTPEQAAVMTDGEVFPLIFLPGFSTVEQVTEIAGRGVGMDVVQNRLNRLRGNVLIDSTPGEGTTFTIRLPLTLSISRAILCRNGQAMIAFPLDSIDEMVELPTDRIKAEGKRRYILWRDRFIPFVPLSELLVYQRPGISTSTDFMKEKEVATVILRSGETYVAVGVDAFIEEQEIVIKQLKGPVDKPQGLAGVTVLGNGQVMSIADVGELIGMVTGQLPAAKEMKPYRPAKVVKKQSQPTVLIVDDSITVRELLSMTFIKAGYRVEQARDGQEATEKLKAGLACDMVFCDVEMPRMDGFEFLSQVQKDSRLKHLPVAMLTSRSADKHRQTAYQLGAKGYFTKPYLEEDLLRGAELLLKGGQMAMV
jgi:chemotaxis protein histidine kinase CheA/ActR/RegA family two-component response regulator